MKYILENMAHSLLSSHLKKGLNLYILNLELYDLIIVQHNYILTQTPKTLPLK